MNEYRRPRYGGTHRPNGFPPRYRRRRWWRPFRLTPNRVELLISLLLALAIWVWQSMRSGSPRLDRPLEFVGLGAIVLALGWGIYVIGKRVWKFALKARTSRGRALAQIVAYGPWEKKQNSTPGKVLPFELRSASGAKARTHRWQISTVWLVVVGLAGGAVTGGLAFKFLPNFGTRSSTVSTSVAPSVSFRLCGSSAEENCVVDGDTIYWGGVKIRLADIDTPEIFSPKCSSELALGQKAKLRLLDLVNAGPFEVAAAGRRDEDVYGRKLRLIMRDGRSLGDVLIAEGLARRWDGARRGWC